MTRYIYLCPKCAKEKHKIKAVHFSGLGIKVFIDGKKPSLFYYRLRRKENVPIVENGLDMLIG